MSEAPYRVGLRVRDVIAAARFYAGLGFDRVAELPGPGGEPVMAILRRGDLQLLVDALAGMPFADNDRERRTQAGPRGLGVVIGIEVDDVDAAARYCDEAGCELTAGPLDAPWGERYAECVDPYGYAWKLFRPTPGQSSDGLSATHDLWFGAKPGNAGKATRDYGPSASLVTDICSAGGSCAFATGDLNVVQKSTDYGRTWGPIVHVSPGFPASGGDSAPMVVEPDGRVDLAYQGYNIYNLKTYAMSPANMYFTSSADGGRTWKPPVQVGASAGTMSLAEWWIDGAIGADAAGNLYITWDTQGISEDIGWISYSTDHGANWSAPVRVTLDNDNATHIVEVAGSSTPGVAYVGWLADNAPGGYAEYLRTFSITRGWLTSPRRVSVSYGNASIWPGDTFGISAWAGNPRELMLSWGSAIGGSPNSEIFAAEVPVSG